MARKPKAQHEEPDARKDLTALAEAYRIRYGGDRALTEAEMRLARARQGLVYAPVGHDVEPLTIAEARKHAYQHEQGVGVSQSITGKILRRFGESYASGPGPMDVPGDREIETNINDILKGDPTGIFRR